MRTLLLCLVLITCNETSIAQEDTRTSQIEVLDYQRDFEDLDTSEVELSITCLSGVLIERGVEQTVLRVSVLLRTGVYSKLASKDYDYVRVLPNNAIKQKSKFRCVSRPINLVNNGIRGDAHRGLLEFEAEVDLNSVVADKPNSILVGEVSLPVFAKYTGVGCKRKFAVFVQEIVRTKNKNSSTPDAG